MSSFYKYCGFGSLFLLLISAPCMAGKDAYGLGYTVSTDQSDKMNVGIHQTISVVDDCGKTVLDVLAYALEGTGYVLAPPSLSDPDIGYLYSQPKPSQLAALSGTHTLSTFLQALAGDGWQLVHNPVRRFISYQKVRTNAERFVNVSVHD